MRFNKFSTINRPQSQGGVTVIEFLIGVAALGVVVMLTMPGISSKIQSHSLDGTMGDLASSLTLAKSESERRRITVRICPSSDGISCYQISDWNQGWLVYSDGNSDGIPQSIELVRAFGPPGKNIRIKATGALSDAPAFTVAGMTSSGLLTSGEFTICSRNSDASSHSNVVVDDEGEVYLVKNDGMSCRG